MEFLRIVLGAPNRRFEAWVTIEQATGRDVANRQTGVRGSGPQFGYSQKGALD